jgi:flavodoxin
MNIAIIYDSVFGNTAKVAEAIGAALESSGTVRLLPVSSAKDFTPVSFDLLIAGSPTRGFRPTPSMSEFVEGLAEGAGRKAAVFDTRIALDDIHPAPLRWVVDAGGYAAARLAASFKHRGYTLLDPGAGFIVTGTEGPLKEGELERAAKWARGLVG